MNARVNRRRFLQAAGATAIGAVVFAGCGFPKHELEVESPARMPEDLVTGTDNWYATLCRMCPAGCGVIVRVFEGRAKKIEGNPLYPVNRGKLCARGQAGLQQLYHPDRIRQPLRRNRATGEFRTVSWDEALDAVARNLQSLRNTPEKVVLLSDPLRGYLQTLVRRLLDYYSGPARPGTAHLTLEPFSSAPLRQAVRNVLGEANNGILPDYDIARAKYVLSFGVDFLSTELSPVRYATAYGEFRQGGPSRGKLVQIDPRFSLTAANADRWVPVQPGAEGILALSMAQVIIAEGLGDRDAADALTSGQGAAALAAFTPEQTATATGVAVDTVKAIAREFAGRRPSLAIGGGPSAAQTNGTFNLSAIMALNFLVGSVGAEGGLRLNPSPIADMPRPYAGGTLPEWRAMSDRLNAGEIATVLVRETNPLYPLPPSLDFRAALARAPFVVSFTSVMNETASSADFVLPVHTYLEEWGDDVPDPAPSHEVVGFQQPVVAPVYDSRSFPDILLDIGRRLGATANLPPDVALPWGSFREMLREGARAIQGLDRGSVRDQNFEAFWMKALQQGGWWDESARYRGADPAPPRLPLPPVGPAQPEDAFPLSLIPYCSTNLGLGRMAHLPWLQNLPDPITSAAWQTWVEVGRQRAEEDDLHEGDIVSVESLDGKLEAPVYVNPALPPTVVAIPLGHGHSSARTQAPGPGSNVFAILSAATDNDTGAHSWAATPVRIVKTGKKRPIPKFEGSVFSEHLEGHEVIETTKE